jgi:DNA gyrase subunit B
VENGHIYLAQPPLYLLKKGKAKKYVQNEEEKEAFFEEFGPDGIHVQRYKGLGEMNPDQLWNTTMNPEHRILKQITVEDAARADQIFDMLMGSNVAPRKNFIQTHAKKVSNLDI